MLIFLSIGLSSDELSQPPSDKHLVRLASKIGIYNFDAFMIHLGMTRSEWEEVEYEFKSNGLLAIKFMALHKWRGKKEAAHSLGKIQDLSKALAEIEDNRHHLCQVFTKSGSALPCLIIFQYS